VMKRKRNSNGGRRERCRGCGRQHDVEDRRLKLLRMLRAISEVVEWKTDDWFILTVLGEEYCYSRDQVRTDLAWLAARDLLNIGEKAVVAAQLTHIGRDVADPDSPFPLTSRGRLKEGEMSSVSLKVLQALGRCASGRSNELCVTRVLCAFGETISRDQVRADLAWLNSRGFVTIAEEILMTAELTERGISAAAGTEAVRGVAKDAA
jgi:hypothetical protein